MTTNEIAAAKTSPYKSSQRPYRGPEAGGGAATLSRSHVGSDGGQNEHHKGHSEGGGAEGAAAPAAP